MDRSRRTTLRSRRFADGSWQLLLMGMQCSDGAQCHRHSALYFHADFLRVPCYEQQHGYLRVKMAPGKPKADEN